MQECACDPVGVIKMLVRWADRPRENNGGKYRQRDGEQFPSNVPFCSRRFRHSATLKDESRKAKYRGSWRVNPGVTFRYAISDVGQAKSFATPLRRLHQVTVDFPLARGSYQR